MKLLLSKKPASVEDDCEYLLIDNFDKFTELTREDIDQIEEIKMVDFLLSMSCFYWLIDVDLSAVARIHFVIMLTDRERADGLRQCIRQYIRKYHYLNNKCQYNKEVQHVLPSTGMGNLHGNI